MARKVDSPKSGYSIGQGLFTTSDLYATPQHVVLSHAAGVASEGILSLLGVGSMQDRANELRRIPLLGTSMNKPPGYWSKAKLFSYGPGPLSHRALRLLGYPLRGDA